MPLHPTILQTLHKGESQLIEVEMIQSDGSDLNFSDLETGTKIEFYQNKSLLKTLLLADNELRQGETLNDLEVEIKADVSELFSKGYSVFIRVYLVATNSDYTASANQQTDIKTYRIANVL